MAARDEAEVARLSRIASHLEREAPAAAGTDPDLTREWLTLRPRMSPDALRAATPGELKQVACEANRLIAALARRRSQRRARRVEVELDLLNPGDAT